MKFLIFQYRRSVDEPSNDRPSSAGSNHHHRYTVVTVILKIQINSLHNTKQAQKLGWDICSIIYLYSSYNSFRKKKTCNFQLIPPNLRRPRKELFLEGSFEFGRKFSEYQKTVALRRQSTTCQKGTISGLWQFEKQPQKLNNPLPSFIFIAYCIDFPKKKMFWSYIVIQDKCVGFLRFIDFFEIKIYFQAKEESPVNEEWKRFYRADLAQALKRKLGLIEDKELVIVC